jgi:hypothetical protein
MCVRLLRLERIQLQTNATGQSAFPNVREKNQKTWARGNQLQKKNEEIKTNKPTKKN